MRYVRGQWYREDREQSQVTALLHPLSGSVGDVGPTCRVRAGAFRGGKDSTSNEVMTHGTGSFLGECKWGSAGWIVVRY